WDIHHFACLIGYGAGAVHPYLALASCRAMSGERGYETTPPAELEEHYRKAVRDGLLKIMSKMGISSIASYRGAQIFEAVGLSQALVDRCFAGTPSRIGGAGLAEIAEEQARRHDEAFPPAKPASPPTPAAAAGTNGPTPAAKGRDRLPHLGYINWRKDGEYHGYNRLVVIAMQKAAQSADSAAYASYRDLVRSGPPRALRDLL